MVQKRCVHVGIIVNIIDTTVSHSRFANLTSIKAGSTLGKAKVGMRFKMAVLVLE